jgi:hypothetical protein
MDRGIKTVLALGAAFFGAAWFTVPWFTVPGTVNTYHYVNSTRYS